MSCKETKRIEAQIEASKAKWGKQACLEVVFLSTDENDFFEFQAISPSGVILPFYAWIDEGTGADPEQEGTAIQVEVNSGDSPAVRAQKAADAINAVAPVKASQDSNVLTIKNNFIGKVEEADASATFELDLKSEGLLVNLGATSDAIDVSFDLEVLTVNTNQTASLTIDEVVLGVSASLSGSFLEITKDKFDKLVGEVTGQTVTPSGGTAVTGFGEGRLFQSLFELGGQLILHPIRLPEDDYSHDTVFWKSAPKVQGESLSGTDLRNAEIEFVAYVDATKDKGINLFAKGDWTQDGLDA